MKTKTSILTALIALASGAGAMAQVYSQNVVGYVNVDLPSGFSLISNPLNGAANTVDAIFPNAPEGLAVYRFNGSGYDVNSYEFGSWGDASMALAPGEGFFIYNPGASYVNTFVGEVSTGDLSNPVDAGYSIVASMVPQAGTLQTDLNYVPAEGDAVYQFNGTGYDTKSYEFGEWSGNVEPVIAVAEGFWIYNASGVQRSWDRTFNPNN